MGSIGGSRCKTTSRKFAMARVPVGDVCFLPKLNQVTRQFAFPITICDDLVQAINSEEKYFIAVYMDSGYWQVLEEEEARKILALFTPYVKRQRKVIPMGTLNAAPMCVAMMTKLHMEWETLAK